MGLVTKQAYQVSDELASLLTEGRDIVKKLNSLMDRLVNYAEKHGLAEMPVAQKAEVLHLKPTPAAAPEEKDDPTPKALSNRLDRLRRNKLGMTGQGMILRVLRGLTRSLDKIEIAERIAKQLEFNISPDTLRRCIKELERSKKIRNTGKFHYKLVAPKVKK